MSGRKYASRTQVPVARSRVEIENLIRKYGAQQFIAGYDEQRGVAIVGFTMLAEDGHPRQVRLQLPLPQAEFWEGTEKQRDAEHRRRWRSLALVIKAKLEAVDSGISTLEREFLADIVLPDGSTVGQWAGPQLAAAYSAGKHPQLLPGPKKSS